MIEPIYKPINFVGQAREFKYTMPTYNLLKIVTICLTIILLSIIGGTTIIKYKQVNNICTSSTK